MWDKETCTVPIIIEALKSISKSIDIYLKKLYILYSLNTSQKNFNVRKCQHFEKSIIYQVKKKLKKLQTLNKKNGELQTMIYKHYFIVSGMSILQKY